MLMQSLTLSPAQVQPIQKKLYQHRKLRCAVLRIDSLHPVVSGNKWFKLKGFLQAVADERKKGVITFGGPWSNHLLATAAACAAAGVSSIGLVRGVPPPQLSSMLKCIDPPNDDPVTAHIAHCKTRKRILRKNFGCGRQGPGTFAH